MVKVASYCKGVGWERPSPRIQDMSVSVTHLGKFSGGAHGHTMFKTSYNHMRDSTDKYSKYTCLARCVYSFQGNSLHYFVHNRTVKPKSSLTPSVMSSPATYANEVVSAKQ